MAHDSNTHILQIFRWLLVGLKPMAHDSSFFIDMFFCDQPVPTHASACGQPPAHPPGCMPEAGNHQFAHGWLYTQPITYRCLFHPPLQFMAAAVENVTPFRNFLHMLVMFAWFHSNNHMHVHVSALVWSLMVVLLISGWVNIGLNSTETFFLLALDVQKLSK